MKYTEFMNNILLRLYQVLGWLEAKIGSWNAEIQVGFYSNVGEIRKMGKNYVQ